MKPIIGMTACRGEGAVYKTNDTYVKAVIRAGGVPVLLPIADLPEDCPRLVETFDALLVPGGVDIAPQYFGEEPRDTVVCVDRVQDAFELELIRRTAGAGKPVFAICRGLQVVNVAFGGTLWQDIPSQCPQAHGHYQKTASRSEEYHTVTLVPGTRLQEIFGERELLTNSYHHQAVKELAPGFVVSARASDGIVEGIEKEDGSILAVQWHPECMEERHPVFRKFFAALMAKAAK
ncbi:MAG: gamma-glutamyl-gamma-aminobutyrate hydrolase family protein [Angelakisella sp.]|jgi:putative glutamine amidotransferase|nr:gamma-glutamyl-gamma-aminobutyrate hydrolase family protein [Angelakisella sp.]